MGESALMRGGPLEPRLATLERVLSGCSRQRVGVLVGGTFKSVTVIGASPDGDADGGRRIALQIHSKTEGKTAYVGVGPYGNLWDAKVAGELTVVSIDGRLTNPENPNDGGWLALNAGENLYLKGTIVEGDVSEASLEIGESSALVEFSDYTQTSFRILLARGESINGNTVAVPLREGELIVNSTIINGKWAKYI